MCELITQLSENEIAFQEYNLQNYVDTALVLGWNTVNTYKI